MQTIFKEKPETKKLGERGETIAVEFLLRQGIKIVMTNFKVPIGRNRRGVQVTGEIDIIAIENETIVFVEVKARSSDSFATPETAVDLRKQRQIIRTAKRYKKIFHVHNFKFRYDVISIVLADKKAPKIEHFKAFFDESRFQQKRDWSDN
jgi:putative endonuclease